jgi:cell shape-determining protein MreD
VFRDNKLALGMGFGFVIGLLWGLAIGEPLGEAFLRGAIATACTLLTYPFWRSKKDPDQK